jgi:hypothetical protein
MHHGKPLVSLLQIRHHINISHQTAEAKMISEQSGRHQGTRNKEHSICPRQDLAIPPARCKSPLTRLAQTGSGPAGEDDVISKWRSLL